MATDTETIYELQDMKSTLGSLNSRVGSLPPSMQQISGTIQSHVLSGSVSIKNFPPVQIVSGTIAVKEVGTFIVRRSGSFWPSTQPVSPVGTFPVSGDFYPPIQEVSGTVQANILGGSITAQVIGTLPVRRVGSFWPPIQEVHMSSGSVGISDGDVRVTSGSIDVREVGTFIVRRSGSFWPGLQEISGTVQGHILSGSVDIRSSALPSGAATETTLAMLPAQGTFDHGRKSNIGTVAVQIATLSFAPKLGVLVKAANSNYARIFTGNSDVTADSADLTDGFELGAGESVVVKVNKVNKVYVRSTGTAQKAFWKAV